MPFDALQPVAFAPKRVTQRDIQSRTLKANLSRDSVVGDTTTQLFGPFTLTASGGGTDIWTITATIEHSFDKDIKVAIAPFKLIFFLGGFSETNVIPYGPAVNYDWFQIWGPDAVPSFKIDGEYLYGADGKNNVYKTSLRNLSASPRTVYVAVQVRAFSGTGAQ